MRAIDMRHVPGASLSGQLQHDPESGNRFSEKIMLKRNYDRRSPIREERMNAPVTVLKSPTA